MHRDAQTPTGERRACTAPSCVAKRRSHASPASIGEASSGGSGRTRENLARARVIDAETDRCDDLYGIAKGQPASRLQRESRRK